MSQPELLILGNINLDLIMGTLDHWPERGTEALVQVQTWRIGGNAGNAVVAAHGLGTPFRAVSTVGEDFAGRWLREQLGEANVEWIPRAYPTSVTVALTHSDGERTFVTQLGHLAYLEPGDLQLQDAAGIPYVLLAGGFLTPRLKEHYPAILQQLKGQGSRVALDMGWPDEGFTPELRAEVKGWLPAVDYLLINELEALELSGEGQAGCLRGAVQILSQCVGPAGVIVVKCGAQGVLLADQGRVFTVHAPQVEVVDSVGAGDTWNAAFLHALLQQRSLEDAAAFAVRVASQAISTSPRRFKVEGHLSGFSEEKVEEG